MWGGYGIDSANLGQSRTELIVRRGTRVGLLWGRRRRGKSSRSKRSRRRKISSGMIDAQERNC